MNNRHLLRFAGFGGVGVLGLALWSVGTALPIASAADPVASASASASGASSAAPVRPKRPEPLDKAEIPEAVSKVPTIEEWKAATEVQVSRFGYSSKECKVLRVREWLKIRCESSIGAIHQHAGNPTGVSFWIQPRPSPYFNYEERNAGELIFPMRKGDRRLLQFYTLRHDACVGVGFDASVMVDETWLENESAPTVVLR